MQVGEKIRQLRIHRKMTQSELVEGISSVAYLSMIENGKSKPSKSFLYLIAQRLNVEVEALLSPTHSDSNERINEIVDRFKRFGTLTESDLSYLRISAMEIQTPCVYLKIFGVLLRYYTHHGEIKEAEEIYSSSLKFVPQEVEEENWKDHFYYYVSCGNLFYYKQDFIKANQYYLQAESFCELLEKREMAQLFYNISLVKQRILEDKSVSLFYSQRSYDIYKKMNDTKSLVEVLITMGVQNHLMCNFDKSFHCLQEAKRYLSLCENDYKLHAMIQYNLGRIYQGKKEYDLAIQHFEDSIRMNDEAFEEKEKIYAYGRLIEIYLELKDWSRIEFYLAESIQMAKKYELIHCYIKLRSVKALTFKLRGDEMKYEKEMKKIIDLSLKKEQFILLVKLANELGEHFYAKRAYKKASDYFKLAQEYHKVLQGINKVACPPVNAYVVN